MLQGMLFAYLPTHVCTYLPFHVNSDFLLTPSRESLYFDNAWNSHIFNHLATTLIPGAATDLATTVTFIDALQLVPLHTWLQQRTILEETFQELFAKIVHALAPLAIVPVLQQTARQMASECKFVSSKWYKLLNQSPHKARNIVSTTHAFAKQMRKLGVEQIAQQQLVTAIQSLIQRSKRDSELHWKIITAMAREDWSTSPYPKALLLQSGATSNIPAENVFAVTKESYQPLVTCLKQHNCVLDIPKLAFTENTKLEFSWLARHGVKLLNNGDAVISFTCKVIQESSDPDFNETILPQVHEILQRILSEKKYGNLYYLSG